MENQRQSEENEMQLKQDVSSRMQDQWNSRCRILCISQTHCQKLSEISQCQIRSTNFAMRISQCQFRNANSNFAMPISISQCQYTVHLSHQNLSEISHCEIHIPHCEFRKPISHCQIHCLCEIHICRPCHPL